MAGAQPLAESDSGAQSQPSHEADLQPASPPAVPSGAPPHVVQTVQKTFSKLYAALKARELQTLRQLDASWRLKNLDSSPEDLPLLVDNESLLIEEISKFGVVDFAKLKIDPDQLSVDDGDGLNKDMFSYKSLDDVLNQDGPHRLRCTQCGTVTAHVACDDSTETSSHTSTTSSKNKSKNGDVPSLAEKRIESCDSFHKLNPTQDWLNQIIYETETEPSQIVDLLEHSAIECS